VRPHAWIAAPALLVAGAIAAPADVVDRVTRTVSIAPGTAIRVDATIADLTVTGSNRADLAVEILRRAPSAAALARFPVAIEEETGLLQIRAVQADAGRDPGLRAEVTIAAPAASVFQAIRVFEGRVKLANLTGACDVDLRRGAIEGTALAGRIRLEAGIGSVDVNQPELTLDGMLRLRVFNGPLRVRFARAPANARILALTLNGTIASDIPLAMKDKFGPRFGETTIGSGEPVVSMDVVKGNISIKIGSGR
jgi:hypothetical protein